MTKPKFTLRTLLSLIVVVAAFFAGRESMRPVVQSTASRLLRADLQLMETKASLAAEIAKREACEAVENVGLIHRPQNRRMLRRVGCIILIQLRRAAIE